MLAGQAGRNAPPACREAVVRRDSVSRAYLCFPRAASYWNCIHLSGNRGSYWEDGLKVRQHQAPADAELLAIPEPGAQSFPSVQPCTSCSALINLRDPGSRIYPAACPGTPPALLCAAQGPQQLSL